MASSQAKATSQARVHLYPIKYLEAKRCYRSLSSYPTTPPSNSKAELGDVIELASSPVGREFAASPSIITYISENSLTQQEQVSYILGIPTVSICVDLPTQ
uniref:Uncharacterized protein n=1 Tax=Picea glauca TaxID=3330 RepID=A0A101LY94_PICGL|nr:hypothetical protein ABT39_MTgene5693 [Picea glauca]QHR89033.1 hypothetical protein Q903MT_gene3052 [Picea sitchensis]